ncbi:MAG: alpha-amylase [Deltaproteobacteria bacterium]|nr:alpha-amylase [Deltaproteobacteria bacterium]
MTHWARESIFYHIYPLGFCGAPPRNDFTSPAVPRLERLHEWIGHWEELEVNALYLGPVFESTAHGYDTADFQKVDRRLGTNETLARLVHALKQRRFRVILDGVFHHVGRNFPAFRDVRQRLDTSDFRHWFSGLSFNSASPFGDPFSYEGWNGHFDLVKLNLSNPDLKAHLFQSVESWILEYGIDGLRLDAADCLDPEFLRALASFCKKIRPDFWLMGEVVRGDYRRWANAQMLDSVTNYECYKGLYSSHVDRNYFEIAYALHRQFGENGLYPDLPLYNFADNHDVNRVTSNLTERRHLYPLYCLLFTMPGVPSIYYGSEWGIEGRRSSNGDRALRPALDLTKTRSQCPYPDLARTIARLARIRKESPALKYGNYRQLLVSHEQLAFLRHTPDEAVVTVLNAAGKTVPVRFPSPFPRGVRLTDLLNPGEEFQVRGDVVDIPAVYPHWARILRAG